MAGPWEKYGSPNAGQQGGVFALPPTQAEVEAAKRQAAADARAEARLAADIEARQEAIRLAREKFEFEKNKTGATGAGQFPKITAKVRQDALDAYNDADALERIAADLEGQFDKTIGKTKGIYGLKDYLPTGTNKTFDDTSFQARGYVKGALGFTGGEGNTIGEIGLNYGPYLPEAGDRDEQIVGKIAALRALAADARKKSISTLGGVPDANGKVTPVEDDRPNAMTYLRTDGGAMPPASAAGFGATEQAKEYPEGYVQQHDALVQGLLAAGGGRLDPKAYVAARGALDRQFNFQPDTGGYAAWANEVNTKLGKGAATVPTGVAPMSEPMSGREQRRNNLVSNPVGAAALNYLDMGGFGGVSLIAGDQMDALNAANPNSALGGQVGGSLTGTALLGRGAAEVAGRFAPGLLGGGQRAALSRALATDGAYSGITGTNQGHDALTSTALGVGGSVVGRGVGETVGRTASGVTSSPTIARLYQQGVRPTLGQIARGRAFDNGGRSFVAGVEDVVANTGAINTFVNGARGRALEDANQAAFNIGGRGTPIDSFGQEGLTRMDGAVDNAYAPLDGISVPGADAVFQADLLNAQNAGQAADAARGRGDFGLITDQQLAPTLGNGPDISGRQVQDSLRLLRGQSRSYRQAANGIMPDPSANFVADAFDQTQDAITDHVGRWAPEVMPAIENGNATYRNLQVLDDAAQRGRNEGYVFTGAQLGDAVKANNRTLGQRGARAQARSPFNQIQQDMQAVLPNKVPPTGVNAAPIMALGGAALGTAGQATDNDTLKTAALLSLPALAYTRPGQAAIAHGLLARPQWLRELGMATRNRSGLFGRAMIPLALGAQ